MNESDEQFLTNLANQFAQDLPAGDQIKILKNLEKLDDEKLVLILNYFLTILKNKEVLTYIVKMLRKCQNDLTIEILSDILISTLEDKSNDNTDYKCEIVKTMGQSKNQKCVMPLLYVLNSKNENYKIRLACAEALGRIGSSYAVTPLIDVVIDEDEKSMYLRESAAKALGMLGDMRAIEPLANILENKNGLFDKFTFLKERIIETLGHLGQYGDAKSIKAIKNALDDETPSIRIGAIEALSEIEDDRVIPLIENMLNDEDEEVARTAVFSLYEILGKDYVISLLKSDSLQECCRDEINSLLEESEVEVEKDE